MGARLEPSATLTDPSKTLWAEVVNQPMCPGLRFHGLLLLLRPNPMNVTGL
jgi:hypothetical protein